MLISVFWSPLYVPFSFSCNRLPSARGLWPEVWYFLFIFWSMAFQIRLKDKLGCPSSVGKLGRESYSHVLSLNYKEKSFLWTDPFSTGLLRNTIQQRWLMMLELLCAKKGLTVVTGNRDSSQRRLGIKCWINLFEWEWNSLSKSRKRLIRGWEGSWRLGGYTNI